MNLIDAVKSGKRFRRPKWEWFHNTWESVRPQCGVTDILAEDWEVEPEPETKSTWMGFRLEIDERLPLGELEIRDPVSGKLLGRLVNLIDEPTPEGGKNHE